MLPFVTPTSNNLSLWDGLMRYLLSFSYIYTFLPSYSILSTLSSENTSDEEMPLLKNTRNRRRTFSSNDVEMYTEEKHHHHETSDIFGSSRIDIDLDIQSVKVSYMVRQDGTAKCCNCCCKNMCTKIKEWSLYQLLA